MDTQASGTCLASLGQRTVFGSFTFSPHLQPGRQGKNEEDENDDDDDDDEYGDHTTPEKHTEQPEYFSWYQIYSFHTESNTLRLIFQKKTVT